MTVPPEGPIPARIMLVGEAPGEEEVRLRRPFVGPSGYLLDKMLGEAGISRAECFITNVLQERPPNNDISTHFAETKAARTPAHHYLGNKWVTQSLVDGHARLRREIELVRPAIVVPLGNVPLWALTDLWGITKWRGSLLTYSPDTRLIPTIHPASILRDWRQRFLAVSDLKRVKKHIDAPYQVPPWRFLTRPSFQEVIRTLDQLQIRAHHKEPLPLSFDIETSRGHIACAGLAWSLADAICIPFMAVGKESGYWSEEEEIEIVFRLRGLLTHPNVQVIGQNIIYDSQYTWKHWGFVPRVTDDTMIGWHSVFSDLNKSLAYIASLTNEYYVYWKDEGKELATDAKGEDAGWRYNCLDTVHTLEASRAIRALANRHGLEGIYGAQQQLFWPVLFAMQRGILIDRGRRAQLITEVEEQIQSRKEFLTEVIGHPLNPDSPKQMHSFFYGDLQLPVQKTRPKKGQPARPTLDDDALNKLVLKEPCIKPLVNAILDIRTLEKFLSNFLTRPLSPDQRMRCSYRIGGSESGASAPKTYRLASAEDAFGDGANLQNIPGEKTKSVAKANARGTLAMLGDPYSFPNIREIFIPDPGYTMFNMDLERADLFTVAWEADDALLKAAMLRGVDIHLLNAFLLKNREPPPLDELVETHARYPDHKGPLKGTREFAKTFIHGTNYGGKPRTMAAESGITINEAEKIQKLWFAAHPGILRWHHRVEAQLSGRKFVENRFGYRWYVFDRLDSILPEAIAWIPQSTTSIVINRIWQRIYEELGDLVEVLMQVHDSLTGQFLNENTQRCLTGIKECARIIVPYDDPLVIPVSLTTSTKSWGDC